MRKTFGGIVYGGSKLKVYFQNGRVTGLFGRPDFQRSEAVICFGRFRCCLLCRFALKTILLFQLLS